MVWNYIITAASVVTALGVILGIILKVHSWYLNQNKQDDDINGVKKKQAEDIASLKQRHEEDVAQIQEENCLICYALAACLDGLMQLGANHTVPLAKEKLDKYLNQQAHKQTHK